MSDQKNKQQQQPQQNQEKGQENRDQKSQGNMHDPSKMPHNTLHKSNMADTKREQPMGSEIENPDRDNDPEKKVSIDDDPELTKKKVPNAQK